MQTLPGQSPEPKLLFPSLQPLYRAYYNLYWPLIRLTAGGILFVHGYNKVTISGLSGVTGAMERIGIQPSVAAASVVIFLETVGALCIVFGLATRFFAAAIAIEMAVVTFGAHFANGFGWTAPRGGWEYPLFWGLIMLAIAMRGGGPLSLDRKIGKEL
jgi:putative oxidoreductase